MNFTKARKELKSYNKILREEENVNEIIMRLKEKCTKITSTFSDMPKGSYDPHKMETAVAELVDETEKYFKLLEKEKVVRRIIENKLNRLDSEYSLLLTERFILERPIGDISKDLHYSERHTKRLINLAIVEYAKL